MNDCRPKAVPVEKRKRYITCVVKAKQIVSIQSEFERTERVNEVLDKYETLVTDDANADNVTTDENYLRAVVVSETSKAFESILGDVRIIKTNFSLDDFSKQIKLFINDDNQRESNWSKMENHVPNIIRSAPSASFWPGIDLFTEIEVAAKKPRIQRKKDEDTEKSKPKNVMNEDNGKKDEYRQLYNSLKKEYGKNDRQPVNFLKFVLDPQSYPKTMENVFNFSFLIRENMANMKLDKNNLPIAEPVIKDGDSSSAKGTSNQMIASFDYSKWQKMVKKFNGCSLSEDVTDYED